MDFFEAQARAKKRTTRLVALFVLAVAGTVAAGYFAAIFLLAQTSDPPQRRAPYEVELDAGPMDRVSLWQPDIFTWVTLGALGVITAASLFKWQTLRSGGRAVARMVGGRAIDPTTRDFKERQLLNVVEEMAIASGVPMPPVYVLDEEAGINAFAAGLTTSDAVVAVTRGTLERLTRDELQGVIGHEFSHILNGDMRLNLRLTAILFGILVIALVGRGVLHSLRFARVRGGRDRNAGGMMVAMLAIGLALMLVGYVGYFFGRLIQAAVSRQREFLADASAVQFTRNPTGITGALRKIGGYAIGSKVANRHAAEINHFFFAQSFRSAFGGLFATHPPLPERIRAIDASFDGTYLEPPAAVEGQPEIRLAADLAPPSAAPDMRPFTAPRSLPFQPAAAVSSAGSVTPAQVEHAQALLARIPGSLRAAAHDPTQAPALIYGLLLDRDASIREKQRALVAQHAGVDAGQVLSVFSAALETLEAAARLPLLQLALPALQQLDAAALHRFLAALDALVHADAQVSPFEYALQKVLTHHLGLAANPRSATTTIHSFHAVATEITTVLSALAWLAARGDDAGAQHAFTAGAAQLKLLEGRLALQPRDACGLDQVDAALDRLAHGSGPIKQRLLIAAGHVVGADGSVLVEEAELLRAIAATLDVPMPPLA